MLRFFNLCLLSVFALLPLPAEIVYHLEPSVDLAAFVNDLKHITNESVTMYLSEGKYILHEPLRFNVSHQAPISIIGRGKVVITGADQLLDWKRMPNGIWRKITPVNARYEQLIVDGAIVPRAKTPNNGVISLTGGGLVKREGKNAIYKAVLPIEYAGELEVIKKDEKPIVSLLRLFTHSRTKILSYNESEGSITFSEPYLQSYYTPDISTGIIIENISSALDESGEWYQDSEGYVCYYPRLGEKINQVSISGARLKNLITISGIPDHLAGNIKIDNIIFEGCDVIGSDEGMPPYQSAYTLDGAVNVVYAKNVNISNCEFRGLGGYAIWINRNCENCSVQRNYIHDVGGGGVKIGGLRIDKEYSSNNIIVSNNIIQRIGRIYMGASGILLTYAQNCEISHNEISDGYYSGISTGFSWGYGSTPTCYNTISYNRIYNLGQGFLNDMAGIYNLGVAPGTIISNNVISNIQTSHGDGFGVYTDEGSSNILIENNVAYYCDGGGFHQNFGSNNIVRNNIFAFGKKNNLLFSSVRKPGETQLVFEKNIILVSEGEAMSGEALKKGNFLFRDNCFFNISGQEMTVNGEVLEKWMADNGYTCIISNPLFRNAEKGDFRLKTKHLSRKIKFKPINTAKAGTDWR